MPSNEQERSKSLKRFELHFFGVRRIDSIRFNLAAPSRSSRFASTVRMQSECKDIERLWLRLDGSHASVRLENDSLRARIAQRHLNSAATISRQSMSCSVVAVAGQTDPNMYDSSTTPKNSQDENAASQQKQQQLSQSSTDSHNSTSQHSELDLKREQHWSLPPLSPPQLAFGHWSNMPPLRGPFLWPCLDSEYKIAEPIQNSATGVWSQPPQVAWGWFVPHPPPIGPYLWLCLPQDCALVPYLAPPSISASQLPLALPPPQPQPAPQPALQSQPWSEPKSIHDDESRQQDQENLEPFYNNNNDAAALESRSPPFDPLLPPFEQVPQLLCGYLIPSPPPPRGPYVYICPGVRRDLQPPASASSDITSRRPDPNVSPLCGPPRLVWGWLVPHPPKCGPYLWPVIPPGYVLAQLVKQAPQAMH